jgi:hypothetical protein
MSTGTCCYRGYGPPDGTADAYQGVGEAYTGKVSRLRKVSLNVFTPSLTVSP